ncbi:MAG: thioredoxin domain-containing protein [Candidatus Sumerlaeaceae bacterium]|nr:thioredoxin domain-containing protein [Candidatus Sumerlaeaceae bacterium]
MKRNLRSKILWCAGLVVLGILTGCSKSSDSKEPEAKAGPGKTQGAVDLRAKSDNAVGTHVSTPSPSPSPVADGTPTSPSEPEKTELVLGDTGASTTAVRQVYGEGRSNPTPAPTLVPEAGAGAAKADVPPAAQANNLGEARSPYLRLSSKSAINWQQWGPEAFALAKSLDRPVLVDIGARWCHWCLVMDDTTYKDSEVIDLLNNNFVAIKVDTDERPDLNNRFQTAYQLINRKPGAWPLTMFTLPDGRAFEGLTFVPPETRDKQVGMREVLKQVKDVYTNKRSDVERQAQLVEQGVNRSPLVASQKADAREETVKAIYSSISKAYDGGNGGFGPTGGPRFPEVPALLFLLQYYSDYGEKGALDMVVKSLRAYYVGGMRDHVMGGFFRYTVDAKMTQPHFEKKLHTQAELLSAYSLAYAASNNSLMKEAARDILKFTRETLENPDGGFYASQSADAGSGDDGSYFTFTMEEIEKIVGSGNASQVFARYLNIKPGSADRSVAYATASLRDTADALKIDPTAAQKALDEASTKLHEERSNRDVIPYVDKTVYASWNALMINAYLEAYKYVGDSEARDFALKSADFILANMVSEKEGVAHAFSKGQASVYGLLEDQALLANALVNCFQVSGKKEYLETAMSLMDFVESRFLDSQTGLYYDRAAGDDIGLARTKQIGVFCNPIPSPNAVAAMTWYNFYQATSKDVYLERAKRMVSAVLGQKNFEGPTVGTFARVAELLVNGAPKALIIGKEGDGEVDKLRETALPVFRMGKLVEVMTPEEAKDTEYKPSDDGSPLVYVCTAQTCAAPTRDPAKVVDLLKTFGRPQSTAASTAPSADATPASAAPRKFF